MTASGHAKGQLKVSNDILRSANLKPDEFQKCLNDLAGIVGSRMDFLVPPDIYDVGTLHWIINLSTSLNRLRTCEGFENHIKTYTKRQVQSSYFVTEIACYLWDHGVRSLMFDPIVVGTGKKPDLLATVYGNQFYIECKTIETNQFSYEQEHARMLSILQNYIDVPHQVDIRYKKTLSDEELHQWGKTLGKRLHQVKGNGKIVNNERLELQVQIRDDFSRKDVKLFIWGLQEDQNERCVYPMHCYGIDGRTISIAGPKVDYSGILKSKITQGRKQAPVEKPYILVIDGNMMLGSLLENVRVLSSAFQPETNTRFSAVIIAQVHQRLDNPELEYKYHFIPNPFARYPVGAEFERLFLS